MDILIPHPVEVEIRFNDLLGLNLLASLAHKTRRTVTLVRARILNGIETSTPVQAGLVTARIEVFDVLAFV